MDRELQVNETILSKGDAIAGFELYDNPIKTSINTTLVLFLANEQVK
ncbi:MAG: hypothetical protein ABTA23_14760 [Solibacillus sp.]